jgi:hypothetical protein
MMLAVVRRRMEYVSHPGAHSCTSSPRCFVRLPKANPSQLEQFSVIDLIDLLANRLGHQSSAPRAHHAFSWSTVPANFLRSQGPMPGTGTTELPTCHTVKLGGQIGRVPYSASHRGQFESVLVWRGQHAPDRA